MVMITERTYLDISEDPIFKALNPGTKHFLEARFLSPALNPHASRGIHVAALTLCGIPHLKTLPAFQMMLEDFNEGRYLGQHTLVIDSSGNTAHAVARLAPVFGFKEVKVIMSADVPASKRGVLAALSTVDIINVSGGKSVAARALEEAQKPGHVRINQYAHLGNPRAHELYTGPQILHALDGNVGIIAVAMGSAGTLKGVGDFFKKRHPGTLVIGVRPSPGEAVPGARNEERMAEVVEFSWNEVTDAVIEVPRRESFRATRLLWSEVEPQPGPTSGLAGEGLMRYLNSRSEGELEKLRGKNAAFICPDHGLLYSDLMIAELDAGEGLK